MNKETKKLIKRLEYNKNKYKSFAIKWWDLNESAWLLETCCSHNIVERATDLLENKRFSALLIEYK